MPTTTNYSLLITHYSALAKRRATANSTHNSALNSHSTYLRKVFWIN
ncbi:hypothetical protein [Anabaena sp. CCY 9402-a]